MAPRKKTIGEKLRELRESYDLTQEQVGKAINLDRSTYSNYELGKTSPSYDTLVKLSHIFDVPKAALLPDDDGDTVSFKDVARADSMLKTLSKEERGLIAYYRTLDKAQKAQLHVQIAKIAKKQP